MKIPTKMCFDLNGNETKVEYAEVKQREIVKRLRGLENEKVQAEQAEV